MVVSMGIYAVAKAYDELNDSCYGYTVCSTFILHFQQEVLSSSGWLSTKSFEHDKVDIGQILVRLKINPVTFRFLSDTL